MDLEAINIDLILKQAYQIIIQQGIEKNTLPSAINYLAAENILSSLPENFLINLVQKIKFRSENLELGTLDKHEKFALEDLKSLINHLLSGTCDSTDCLKTKSSRKTIIKPDEQDYYDIEAVDTSPILETDPGQLGEYHESYFKCNHSMPCMKHLHILSQNFHDNYDFASHKSDETVISGKDFFKDIERYENKITNKETVFPSIKNINQAVADLQQEEEKLGNGDGKAKEINSIASLTKSKSSSKDEITFLDEHQINLSEEVSNLYPADPTGISNGYPLGSTDPGNPHVVGTGNNENATQVYHLKNALTPTKSCIPVPIQNTEPKKYLSGKVFNIPNQELINQQAEVVRLEILLRKFHNL